MNFRLLRLVHILGAALLLSGSVFIQQTLAQENGAHENRAEEKAPQQPARRAIHGFPHDWSHEHVVFSNPGSMNDAMRSGSYSRWYKTISDPRWAHQQFWRSGLRAHEDSKTGRMPEGFGHRERPTEPPTEPLATLHSDWNETLSDAHVQPNAFPAKWSFDSTSYSCANDYVVYPTGSAGSASLANIIAYNNLYATTCGPAAVPSTYWAYNTGAFIVSTSPVLSGDGTKVAFVESAAASMKLVVLKFDPSGGGTFSAPITPTTSTNISTCTAPCMSVTTAGTAVDNYSSPYYDYTNDVLYVGDGISHLYKFTGVFNGTSSPTVSTVTLNASGHNVASPVYDPISGCVFVGDNMGFFYSVSSGIPGTVCTGSTFALVAASDNLGNGTQSEGFFDGVLLDSAAQVMYGFVTSSAAVGNCPAASNCIYQFSTNSVIPNNEEPVGTGAMFHDMLSGTFDNVYYSSAGGNAGNLWTMGNTATSVGANLYRIPIGANSTMSTPVAAITGLTNTTTGAGWPSPITEFCNNGGSPCVASGTATTSGNDYIFFSVNRLASSLGACGTANGNGCVLSYTINTPANTPVLTGAAQYATETGGGCWTTGGIVVDNAATAAGTSQIYFISLNGNDTGGVTNDPGCAATTGNNIGAVQANQNNP